MRLGGQERTGGSVGSGEWSPRRDKHQNFDGQSTETTSKGEEGIAFTCCCVK